MSVHWKCNLIQSGVHYFVTKFFSEEHITVCDRLHPIVANFFCILYILRKLWINACFSSWENHSIICICNKSLANFLLYLIFRNQSTILRFAIEAEFTFLIAGCCNSDPNSIFFRSFFFGEKIIFHAQSVHFVFPSATFNILYSSVFQLSEFSTSYSIE